jgi:hypothetical protein
MEQQEGFTVYPPIKKTLNMCKFTYKIIEIKLFEYVRIIVYLYGDNDLMLESRHYVVDGDSYKKWSSDDQYIITLIKQKIQEPFVI